MTDLVSLAKIAIEINQEVDRTVKMVVQGKLKVGELLLEARSLLIDDFAFGEWRTENTVVQSKQHAHYLMQVAKRFAAEPKLIESVNYSTLQELVLADQKDIEWVQDKVKKGEKPTVAEVRTKVKETQAERLAPKGTSKKAGLNGPTSGPVNPNMSLNELVTRPLTKRIQQVVEREIKGIEGDFIILGMDPDPQTPCHSHVLKAIRDLWEESTDDANELRAVKDSYERVREEFTNWT